MANNVTDGGAVPEGAVEMVREFLKNSIDVPNEAVAKSFMSADTLANGTFAMPAELAGGKYTIGAGSVEKGQVWIPVEIDAAGQKMTIPLAPIEEGGAWKLDMGRTMQKMMGGMMEEAVGQMATAVGEVMQGVGAALGAAPGAAGAAAPAGEGAPKIDAAVIGKFQAEVVGPIEKEMEKRLDYRLPVEVDFAGLLTGADEAENKRLLEALKSGVFSNWGYFIGEVNGKIPLDGRLKGIRLEGVKRARERAVFSEGARVIYRLNLVEEKGFYDGQEWEGILLGVVAGMAETAPAGEVAKGPSFVPKCEWGEGKKVLKDYREFVEPVLLRRMGGMLGRELEVEVEWDMFDSEEDAKGLWVWGLNRLCGAIGLLGRTEGNKELLSQGLSKVRFLKAAYGSMKAANMEGPERNELWLYFAPGEGEAGGLYEGEIADALTKGLKLRLKPMVGEVERYMKSWEASLLDTFKRPIKFAADFDGFIGHPEEQRSLFAMTLLKEHGIDALYYAVTNLAEKNPNFKQQFAQRVKWLYVESVGRKEGKMVDGEQTTIRLRVFLFEGYEGYLTIKELEKALPGIVAGMPDLVFDEPELDRDTDPKTVVEATAGEAAELEEMAAVEDAEEEGEEETDEDEEGEEEGEEAEETAPAVEEDGPFKAMKSQMVMMFETFKQQFAGMVGKALPLDIEWASLGGKAEGIGMLLNASLTPLLGAMSVLGQDPEMRAAVGRSVAKIVMREAKAAGEAGFALADGVLVYSANLAAAAMDPTVAAEYLKGLLKEAAGKPAPKESAKKKAPPAKAKKKPGAKKAEKPKGKAVKKGKKKK